MLTNLRRCCLQSDNLDRLIFVSKNWPNDFIIYCKLLSNLMEMIEKDLYFVKEFEGFESSFEQYEFVDIQNVGKKFMIFSFFHLNLF